MKKLIKLMFTALAVMTLTTACDEGESVPVYTSIGTVIDGSFDVPYYILFDDGKKAYVNNTTDWTPTFANGATELRLLISYTVDETEAPLGYDLRVNLSQLVSISTSDLERVTDADFTGDKGLQKYDAEIRVDEGYYSAYSDYITLMVVYSAYYADSKHTVKLVYNASEESGYKSEYKDDGYLWLELYHDSGDDQDSALVGVYTTYKVDTNKLGVDPLTNYKGLKIVSKGMGNGSNEVYTVNFQQ